MTDLEKIKKLFTENNIKFKTGTDNLLNYKFIIPDVDQQFIFKFNYDGSLRGI